ncbi:MAG: O-antigen ligase family protein [Acidobacteria bacterium]|nr:O-antigen ligase family protein [Acidobacteriota bacterium]
MTETRAVLEATTQPTKRRLNRMAVAVTVAMLPAWSLSFAESPRGFGLTMITVVAVLLALATAIDGATLARLRTRPATVILYAVLAVGAIIAFVFNPSGAGAILAFSIVAPIGVVVSVARYSISELRSYVALPLLATTAIQAFLVAAQTATESAVGYNLLYPGTTLLVTNDTIVRPQGMFDHVYEPAAVALITIGIGLALLPESGRLRMVFLAGVGAAATTIALTHSRSALLGLLLVLLIAAIAAFRGDRGLRIGFVVVAAAFVIPALLTASAWQVRFDESANSDLDDASLGRITLARQAITMAGDHPVVGVGPNRYMAVLEARYTVDETYPFVVHNESLMLAAELGIPAAVAVTLLLVWAGVQAAKAGYRPLLLYAAPLAFFVFDVLLYNKPVGLLLFAVWAGVMAAASDTSRKSQVASSQVTSRKSQVASPARRKPNS